MPDRSRDWFEQAKRDLAQAKSSQAEGRHEWACFAAHQAAEKAVKALHREHYLFLPLTEIKSGEMNFCCNNTL